MSAVDPGGLPGDLSAHDICWQIGPAHRLARHLDTFGADFDRDVDRDRGFGGGGGQIAVAANWFALHPDLVRMEHGRDFVPRIAELVRDNRHLGLGNAGKLGWQMQDLNAAGVAGNAAAPAAEKGRAFVDHAARQIVALLGGVHRLALSWLDTAANPDAFP